VRVLVACECSGEVRDAFRARGHYAVSCDLKPDERDTSHHFIGDVRGYFLMGSHRYGYWNTLIAHPPCTYLSSSGLHWNKRRPERAAFTDSALAFVADLMRAPVERICIENPIGCIGTRLAEVISEQGFTPTYVQPYQYGHDACKRTVLWLKNLPPLRPTQFIDPRIVNGKPRWANQTDSGQNRLGPSPTRAADRARTYPGIAAAMAWQWG